jgi:anti-sigma factor (TIGR02949 family)
MENSETDCRAVLTQLYLYLDGEIAGGECTQIEVHLERCQDCMQHAEFERAVKEIVRRKCGSEQLPDGFLDRLRGLL